MCCLEDKNAQAITTANGLRKTNVALEHMHIIDGMNYKSKQATREHLMTTPQRSKQKLLSDRTESLRLENIQDGSSNGLYE